MLLRLWQDERPRNVLVAWDTLDVPTYRHQALEAYQSGRVFDDELLEQLDLLPGTRGVGGLRVRQGAWLRGRRLPGCRRPDGGGSRRVGAGGDVGSRRVPARDGSCHRSPARSRGASGSDRPGRGARALRGRSRAGARLHRTPRRPLGQDSGRTWHRSEARRRAARPIRIARRACSRQEGSPARRMRSGCTAASRRWTPTRRCRRSPTCRPTGQAAKAYALELGAPGVARRFEEALAWT